MKITLPNAMKTRFHSTSRLSVRRFFLIEVLTNLLLAIFIPVVAEAGVQFKSGSPFVGTSGKTVICQLVDSTTFQPARLTAQPNLSGVTVKINNGAAINIADAVWQKKGTWQNASSYCVLALPAGTSKINPADTVSLSAPAGWLQTDSGSMSAPINNLPVANLSGQEILAAVDVPNLYQNMTLGYNAPYAGGYWCPAKPFGNLMKCAGAWVSSPSMLFDTNGYPYQDTSSTGWDVFTNLNNTNPYPSLPGGVYTVMWDGATGNVYLGNGGNATITEQTGQAVTGQATNNKRVYTVSLSSTNPPADANGGMTGASVALNLHIVAPSGGNTVNVTNIRAFAPSVTITNGTSKLGYPNFITNISKGSCLRMMQLWPVCVSSSLVDASDLPGALDVNGQILDVTDSANVSHDPYSYTGKIVPHSYQIVKIEDYPRSNTDSAFIASNAVVMKVTVSTSGYTFKEGQSVAFPSSGLAGTLTYSSGNTTRMASTNSIIHKLSATTFLVGTWDNGSTGDHLTSTYYGSGNDNVTITTNNGVPPPAQVKLCNEANVDLWFNLPQCVSDDCAYKLGTYIAKNLNSGRKVYLEMGDEPWNSVGFYSYGFCYGEGALQGLSWIQYQTTRTAQLATQFRNAFAAAGRSMSDVLPVINMQMGAYNLVPSVVAQWNSLNPGFLPAAICVAPYYNNQPDHDSNGSWGFNADHLDLDQSLDIYEMAVDDGTSLSSDISLGVGGYRQALNNNSWNAVGLVCYEGGHQDGSIGGTIQSGNPPAFTYNANQVSATNLTPNRRSQYTKFHPRFRNVVLHQLQKIQESGFTHFNQFIYAEGFGYDNKPADIGIIWDTLPGSEFKPGTGSVNMSAGNLGNLLNMVSVEAQAFNDWMSAHINKPKPVAPTVSVTSPTNNQMISTPTVFTLSASASEMNGAIWKVEYYVNGGATPVAVATSSPWNAQANISWPGSSTVTAVAYDTLGVSTTSAPVNIICMDTTSAAYINFQTATTTTPIGYDPDSGLMFDAGRGYGWDLDLSANSRERHVNADKRLDTFVFTAATRNWTCNLANGTYNIQASVGDPSYQQGPNRVVAQGVTLINNITTSANIFASGAANVTVTNSQLSMQVGNGTNNTALNYVIMTPVAPMEVDVDFEAATTSTPVNYYKDCGLTFSPIRGYGWDADLSGATRERVDGGGNDINPDKRLDTFVFTTATRTWTCNLPNGNYLVQVSVGDPSSAQGPNKVVAQGTTLINNVSTTANNFVTGSASVTVTNSQLSLQVGNGTNNTAINYITIKPN